MKPKQGGSYQSSSTTASSSYGANGLRKSKSVGGKTTGFVWDRGNVAAEISGSTITNMYNYGPDGLTEREKSNGEISIYLKNAHGDVTGVSDEYGIPEERYQFDAFGNTQTETEPAPLGYCGEYRDAESGLIYLRNRYYDTETGRFITEDPVKDGTNWYVYAANNPLMFVDPWGLLDVPNNGAESFSSMIAILSKIISYKVDYQNEAMQRNPDRQYLSELSNGAQQMRNMIDVEQIRSYSPQLAQLVEDNVLNTEGGGSIEQVPAVLAIYIEARQQLFQSEDERYYIGSELIPESKVNNTYEYYLNDGNSTVFIAGNAGSKEFNTFIDDRDIGAALAQRMLVNGYYRTSNEFEYIGWDIYGNYRKVLIYDLYKIWGPDYSYNLPDYGYYEPKV